MSIDILIHKNTYTKIQSALTYGFIQNTDKYKFHVINCHNNIYDVYYSLRPNKLLLQIEEYSNEFHTFVHDTTIPIQKVLLSIDNNKINYDTYIKILEQIRTDRVGVVANQNFVDYATSKGMPTSKFIVYNNIINKYVFFNKHMIRNNKILCILSSDKACVATLEKYLYPKTKTPIVMVNNPEVQHDQNIGLMLDDDMNNALNSYGSVIDLSQAYDAEISTCKIPKHSIEELDNLLHNQPSIIDIPTEDAGEFINTKLMSESI